MQLSEALKEKILDEMRSFCRSVRKAEPQEALAFILSEEYLYSQSDYYTSVMNEISVNITGKKILEIGSGYGFFLIYGLKELGWDIYGIEPRDKGRFDIACQILSENSIDNNRLLDCAGENIEVDSESFDIIVSNDVLEHVADPGVVIREALRILKPGGILIFNFNNYRWFYEAHYNIFWFPFMSKSLSKKYVELFKRDSDYIDHLNFLSPYYIKKIIKHIPSAKLCLPLSYKSADFIIERAKAYIKCQKENSGKGLSFLFIRVLVGILSIGIFRSFMQSFADLTGIYHEMHLVIMKEH